ncbi:MAG TPA: DNA replication and repair protein RecF [bacterium]|nr:DNA replication and repair protein RecF [bacterium]
MKKVSMFGFRNLQDQEFCPAPGLNILQGENAQGKTNVLEAIYLLRHTRSFRPGGLGDYCRWGEISFALGAEILLEGETRQDLRILFENGKRKATVNGNGYTASHGAIKNGMRICGLFPETVAWLEGTASFQRRYLDQMIVSIDGTYLPVVRAFHHALAQRNALLRMPSNPGWDLAMESWEEELASLGSRIILARRSWAAEIQNRVALTAGRNWPGIRVEISYTANGESWAVEAPASEIQSKLATCLVRSRTEEKRYGATLVGPHRDRVRFLNHGADLKTCGSRGERWLAAILLLVVEVSLCREAGYSPIVLMDEVETELDGCRAADAARLLETFDQCQIFATSLGKGSLWTESPGKNRVFEVRQGLLRTAA